MSDKIASNFCPYQQFPVEFLASTHVTNYSYVLRQRIVSSQLSVQLSACEADEGLLHVRNVEVQSQFRLRSVGSAGIM
jgi:hypothetical protein